MIVSEPRTAVYDCPAPDRRRKAFALGTTASIVLSEGRRGRVSAAVSGELDLSCAGALAQALRGALDEWAAGVELDMAGVRFFDCAALHALEHAARHAERRGRALILERSSQAVDLVLDLAVSPGKRTAAPGARPAVPTALV